jgi:predicted O-methyltransferase YrrM
MKHIIFCLPGAPTLQAAMSWDALVREASRPEHGLKLEVIRGYNSSVAHCRNNILEEGVSGPRKEAKPFGGRPYDFMMWIDSDSVYTPQDFFRLLEADKDIITGMVPMNAEGAAGAFGLVEGPLSKYVNLNALPQNAPMRDWHFCGFAFLLVRRGVFETLDFPWFQEVPYEEDGRVILPGEDIDWCRRIRAKGFKIWAHPAVRIGHDIRMVVRAPGPPVNLLEKFIDRYDHAWRMSRPAIDAILQLLEQRKPKKVLELGPGASSFAILPWCLEHGSRYLSLDHAGPYGEKHLANLREAGLPAETTFGAALDAHEWYHPVPPFIEALAPYDLVIVDGPVEGRASPPALAAYIRWGHPGTAWVFDDVNREQERAAAASISSAKMSMKFIRDPDYPRQTCVLIPDLDERGDGSHTVRQNVDAEAVGHTASKGQPEAIA